MSALEGMIGQGGMPDLSAAGETLGYDMSQEMFGGGLKGKTQTMIKAGYEQDGQTNARIRKKNGNNHSSKGPGTHCSGFF